MIDKVILPLCLFLLSFVCSCSNCGTITLLEPKTFNEKISKDKRAVVLDVRRPEEYAAGHLRGAVNSDWMKRKDFEDGVKTLDKSKKYYVYCRSGKRSHAAAERLKASGFKVVDMSGGYLNWTGQGLPIVTQ